MNGGWRYRLASVAGVVALTVLVVALANSSLVQSLLGSLPLLNRLPVDSPSGMEGVFEITVTVVVVTAVFIPLYKPRPRRIVDTVVLGQKRVLVAMLALATIGYFDYTYRLPRLTLLTVAPLLLVVLPAWFVWIRRRPSGEAERAIIVGDDPDRVKQLVEEVDIPLLGYLCPTVAFDGNGDTEPAIAITDGGTGLERLGGLSRIEDVLVEYDVDTVVLAFEHTDRAEFFGALDACYEHGVAVKVHRDHADAVLTEDIEVGTLVDVQVEPWDIQDYVFKRGFDVAFAGTALFVLSPVIALIALAIKLEGNGPILFSQDRTYLFGETFTVYKFRTLKPDPDGEVGTTFEGDRETPLGNFLRTTHLDEIPQLWSILTGGMSVVGPRPAQTALEDDFEAETAQWRQRWFVKPGLTGLAQINEANSQNPREKIQYDIQYIRNQGLWYDLKIVIRQLWKVFQDVLSLVWDSEGEQ
ncbi:sugar transferase [Haloarchaeobius sp. FL176]|uniref:sugar transferase n=1 Tax=Haloarchaeobius sp. FL176 TaxID=2967129 RepID=UPI0021492673|nr:sugar transferase [Haloarchaeobius sp. FL176]